MSLFKQISEDLKEAMKKRDSETLDVLRVLVADLKNLSIEMKKEVEDADVLSAVKRDVKRLKDAAGDFAKGAREDLVQKAKKEIEILEKYLPEGLSDEEIEVRTRKILSEYNISEKSQIGKAMGFVMKELASVADGTKVREVVQKILGESEAKSE